MLLQVIIEDDDKLMMVKKELNQNSEEFTAKVQKEVMIMPKNGGAKSTVMKRFEF
jgi:hypothetical protein